MLPRCRGFCSVERDFSQAREHDLIRLDLGFLGLQNVVSYSNLFSTEKREDVHSSSESQTVLEKSNELWKLGAALAGVLGGAVMKARGAIAADEPVVSAEVVAQVVRAVPGWVGPTVLAFPVVSYVIFSLYREKVSILMTAS